jgi:type VI protein secretion system component Hcp
MKTHHIVVCAFAGAIVLGHTAALAEEKPRESVNFNYGKLEYKYTTESDRSTGQATGKRQHQPFQVSKESNKSSPNLMQSSSPGGGTKPTTTLNPALKGDTLSAPPKSGWDLKANKKL